MAIAGAFPAIARDLVGASDSAGCEHDRPCLENLESSPLALVSKHPDDAIATFHTAWQLMAIPATAAGLIALALGRVRARNPEAAVVLAAAEA